MKIIRMMQQDGCNNWQDGLVLKSKPIYDTNQTITWFDTINKKHWFFGFLQIKTSQGS